ncbi:hypothetical protein, partial [Brevibacillus centrosporus]|uniref:hypothetical protein n=1 Tax=Brevibacillus centrosporus TaxID=54910 RepID=UPI00381B9BB2
EKVTHPTGGLIFAMVVNFLMSTVVNILIDIHIISGKQVNKQQAVNKTNRKMMLNLVSPYCNRQTESVSHFLSIRHL